MLMLDGTITYGYGGRPVPESITWAGPVEGTVTIGRNAQFQATSVAVGIHTANLSPDADGVQMQAGEMALERDAATFLKGTELGSVTDRYQRNQFGEPTFYEAKHATAGVLFSEDYEPRDQGGRIKHKTVRIADGAGGIETYTARYEYYPTGQLRLVQYNDQPVIEYVYDSNNNLTGEPETPSGAIFQGPRRLYLNATAPTEAPSGYEGTWTSTSGAATAQMSPAREGTTTETEVATASCEEGDTALVTTFVSTPLSSARTFQSGEQVRMVVGARQTDSGDALQAVATLWLMDGNGDLRCQIAVDHELSQSPLPVDAEGIGTYLPLTTDNGQLTTPCGAGTVAQPGDRIVAEIGYRCTTDEEVEGAISRGGQGPALTEGGDPTDHACGQPGYVELDGDWAFASDMPTPCEDDDEQTVLTTRRTSITINASNQATAASIVDPDGTPREYEYTYDSNGALDIKTDVTDPNPANHEVTDYDYDDFGNLRHVSLPDGRTIDYLIDAANRRVGRVLKDDAGAVIDEKRWLYQSALRPVAELDGGNNITSFFVYADKPNVPEYMDLTEARNGHPAGRYRIITDHLGSVRLVVSSATGVVAQRIDYDEWGSVTQDTSPGFQPFGFAGGLYDADGDHLTFGVRDYAPNFGRWLQADPLGFEGAAGNVYEHSNGDSVNMVDPLGADAWQAAENFSWGLGLGAGGSAVALAACTFATGGTCGVVAGSLAGLGMLGLAQDLTIGVSGATPNGPASRDERLNARARILGGVAVGAIGGVFTRFSVPRGTIGGPFSYQPRIRARTLEDPTSHAFPYSFDKVILRTKPIRQSDGSLLYRVVDEHCVYDIAFNPKTRTIFHRTRTSEPGRIK